MKYRAEVDGLRAVAVIPVILFHAGFGYFSGGFVGVDIFSAVPDIPLGPVIRGYEESAFVNFLEQSHDAAGGWPRYGGPPAAG